MSFRILSSSLSGIIVLAGMGLAFHATARQNPPKSGSRPAANTQSKPPNTVKPGPQAKPADPKAPRTASLDAESSDYDEQTKDVVARKFVYRDGDMTITGEFARYNDDTKRLLAKGDLVMDDPKYHMTGDNADVDNSKGKKLAIITGRVNILIKPKEKPADADKNGDKGAGSERRRGGTVTCDRAESYYKKEFSILTGNLTFKQTITRKGREVERTVTAEKAEYDGKAEKMTLYPPVRGRDTDGQTMESEEIVIIGTKEGAETVQTKKAKFVFNVEDEEEEDDKTPPPPAKKDK